MRGGPKKRAPAHLRSGRCGSGLGGSRPSRCARSAGNLLAHLTPGLQIPLVADATPRLACVDLDWDHVRAVDIMVVLRSFAPAGGAVRRVAVYPSDYGLQRMAEEAEAGPRGIWDAEDADGEAGEASDDDDKRAQGLQGGLEVDGGRSLLRGGSGSECGTATPACLGPGTCSCVACFPPRQRHEACGALAWGPTSLGTPPILSSRAFPSSLQTTSPAGACVPMSWLGCGTTMRWWSVMARPRPPASTRNATAWSF